MSRKSEFGIGLVVTLLAAGLHFFFLSRAGGLWRDEAGAINLASLPGLGNLWAHLHYDSFPIFWVLVVREWMALGFGSDGGLRLLGCLTGLAVFGALWFNAWRIGFHIPFFSLLLLGFCPTLIIWGDSMRAWGWGVIWILLAFGCVWRLAVKGGSLNFITASLAAIASVQTTYHNSVLVFAICVAGAAVKARHRLWKQSFLPLGVGGLAAASLLPYLGVMKRGADEYVILQGPFDLRWFAAKILEAIASSGISGVAIWALLLIAAFAVAAVCWLRPARLSVTPGQLDLILFSGATLLLGVASTFVFLKALKFLTQPWYYVALLAVMAMALDSILSVPGNLEIVRRGRLVAVLLAACILVLPAIDPLRLRLTNVDVIAKMLAESANKEDLIVVNPWYCGVSFQRYYSGPTPWITLPEIPDHQLHRYDTIKHLMTLPDQKNVVQLVLDRCAETLKAGNRVWVVGGLSFLSPGQTVPELPPAPQSPTGWRYDPYFTLWTMQAGSVLQTNLKNFQTVPVPIRDAINPLEKMPVTMIEGWK